MNEEEKKSIERLENYLDYASGYGLLPNDIAIQNILNLVEKQHKELEVYKNKYLNLKNKLIEKLELYSDDRSIFNYDNEIHLLQQLLESE